MSPTSEAALLHVETQGEGPPVVLLHSSGLSSRQWRRLAAALPARGFRAVSVDLAGHGAAPPWTLSEPFAYTLDVDAVAALVEELSVSGPVHLVGHSYGGLLALLAALRRPPAVASLSAFEPVAFGVLDPARDAAAFVGLDALDLPWGDDPAAHELWLKTFVEYWGGAGAWGALREDARAEFRRVGWAVWGGVTTLQRDLTRAEAYAALGCPVLLMTGTLSPPAPARIASHLAATIPRARVVGLEGVGHMAPLTHADLVNGLILDALTAAK
jgi:pimeloyl-ACP methyl ester carboxylesterase